MHGIVPATRFDKAPDLEMRFPPLPTTLAEVSRLLAEQTDNPDTHKLVEIVNRDPVIAASVLRRINSAYYGMRRLIGDLRKAVFLLGFLEVGNIVMTAAVMKLREILVSREQRKMFAQIMRVSVTSAFYTQELARAASLSHTPIAFTAGLLHSIGRLVLLYNKPHDYEALWCTSETGMAPSIEAERLIFGTDHARLGAQATERWNLPGDIGTVIGYYPTPSAIADTDLRKLAHALALATDTAETACLQQITPASEEPSETLFAFAEATGTSISAVTDLLETILAQTPAILEELLRD